MIETKRPKLELLGGALVERIVDEGLTLLETQGMMIVNAEALRLLGDAGAVVDSDLELSGSRHGFHPPDVKGH